MTVPLEQALPVCFEILILVKILSELMQNVQCNVRTVSNFWTVPNYHALSWKQTLAVIPCNIEYCIFFSRKQTLAVIQAVEFFFHLLFTVLKVDAFSSIKLLMLFNWLPWLLSLWVLGYDLTRTFASSFFPCLDHYPLPLLKRKKRIKWKMKSFVNTE